MKIGEIKNELENAETFSDVYNVLSDYGMADILSESDYVLAEDVADRLSQALVRDGLEAIKDYRDLDPYGEVFYDTGLGYFEDATIEDVKNYVNSSLNDIAQDLETER